MFCERGHCIGYTHYHNYYCVKVLVFIHSTLEAIPIVEKLIVWANQYIVSQHYHHPNHALHLFQYHIQHWYNYNYYNYDLRVCTIFNQQPIVKLHNLIFTCLPCNHAKSWFCLLIFLINLWYGGNTVWNAIINEKEITTCNCELPLVASLVSWIINYLHTHNYNYWKFLWAQVYLWLSIKQCRDILDYKT